VHCWDAHASLLTSLVIIQGELEACGADMERMAPILDELDALSKQVRRAAGTLSQVCIRL